uniref:Uncharacterized protein n=1 Tax=Timema monikensis TaxID=170555 RepID=A0A7R9EAS6_9NEOP|nr:unnamed protein product [Timema monikensis]
MGNHLMKTVLSTPYWDSSPDLLIIGTLVYCEGDALEHCVQPGLREDVLRAIPCQPHEIDLQLLIMRWSCEPILSPSSSVSTRNKDLALKADLIFWSYANFPKKLCHAATKIQASFRGHMARKQVDEPTKGKPEDELSKELQKLDAKCATILGERADEEELDIDLSDPDLHKAATKIQASFRGHKVRKETEGQ